MIPDKDASPKCPECKRRVVKLVSYTDDGKGVMMCHDCKRKKKRGEKIERFKG